MSNLADFLHRSADVYPEKTAIVYGDIHISYQYLRTTASSIAKKLKDMGVGRGDTVALSCPNIPQFVMVYYGIVSTGAAVVPLSILLKPGEIQYHLQDSKAIAYFCFEGTDELPIGHWGLEAFKETDSCPSFIAITASPKTSSWQGQSTLSSFLAPSSVYSVFNSLSNDTAAILYTSGTTGKPKGAELSHHNLAMNTLSCMAFAKTDAKDTHLIVLPLFHSFAQTVQMHHAIASGSTMILLARFDAETVLNTIAKEKVTIFAGVPTMYIGLNAMASHIPPESKELISENLRVCVSGGGPMPLETLNQFEKNFQVTILEGYGLSETSPAACFNSLDHERIAGSIGRPISGIQVKIIDENGSQLPPGKAGELLIKGHNVMKGYLNNLEQTEQSLKDGWFHTGDIARSDEAGNLYIVDRLKDMIIRGGFNVYPREVEEVLITHPAIQMVAVIGVPDDHYVEEIMACIVLNEGAIASAEDIKEWSQEQLGCYKYPRHIKILDKIPLTATGKILKRELRSQIIAGEFTSF